MSVQRTTGLGRQDARLIADALFVALEDARTVHKDEDADRIGLILLDILDKCPELRTPERLEELRKNGGYYASRSARLNGTHPWRNV